MTRYHALLLALFFAATLPAPFLLAQQDAEPVAEAGTDNLPVNSEAEDDIVPGENTVVPAEPADDTPIASNEDFNPSVQISEDLSVSFPVDI